jgi:hypothetical protein
MKATHVLIASYGSTGMCVVHTSGSVMLKLKLEKLVSPGLQRFVLEVSFKGSSASGKTELESVLGRSVHFTSGERSVEFFFGGSIYGRCGWSPASFT